MSRNHQSSNGSNGQIYGVEPEGFEPSSKQGNNEPSTCLDLFYCREATVISQSYCNLSSFSFAIAPERYNGYPVIYDASIETPTRRASRET
jgi:hypothetical protein